MICIFAVIYSCAGDKLAMLCLLAENCTKAAYTRLVEALCTKHVNEGSLFIKVTIKLLWFL